MFLGFFRQAMPQSDGFPASTFSSAIPLMRLRSPGNRPRWRLLYSCRPGQSQGRDDDRPVRARQLGRRRHQLETATSCFRRLPPRRRWLRPSSRPGALRPALERFSSMFSEDFSARCDNRRLGHRRLRCRRCRFLGRSASFDRPFLRFGLTREQGFDLLLSATSLLAGCLCRFLETLERLPGGLQSGLCRPRLLFCFASVRVGAFSRDSRLFDRLRRRS